jgi:hypothetical protein
MTITHCDDCGTTIVGPHDSITISRGFAYRGVELCGICGAPAAELLDRVLAKCRDNAALRTAPEAVQ